MKPKIPIVVVLFVLVMGAALNDAVWPAVAAPSDVVYFDLVVDEARQLLYGSDRNGGSIQVISIATLEVISTVSVGALPSGIDLSPDGNFLAVALSGQSEIAILDLNTLTVINRIVPQGTGGSNMPYDVLFGRPGRLYSVGSLDTSFDYVHVFETGAWLEIGRSTEIIRDAPRLAMTADQNTLYVSQVTGIPQKIYRFDVTTDTPTQTAVDPHGPVAVNTLCVMPDNKVYTSRGQVWSADLSALLGTFPAAGDEIECSESKQRVFVTSGTDVISIDTFSLSRKFVFPLPGSGGVARLDPAGEVLYVSTDAGLRALAANTEPFIYLPFMTRDYCSGFFDDFSNPASGWAIDDNDYVRSEYTNGEFLIHTKQAGYLYLYRAPSCLLDNYTVEVDVRWQEKTGNSHGLLFDIQEDFSNYYLFVINTDYQDFLLYRRSPSGFTQIVGWTVSPAIHAGQASNRLKVRRSGNYITLYVNGVELGAWWDDAIPGSGGVGILSSPYNDRPKSDALFDNFRLAVLSAASAVTASPSGKGGAALGSPLLENLVAPAPAEMGH